MGPDAPLPEVPVVTAIEAANRRVVHAADAAAAASGLRPGMAVTQAMAALPGLIVLQAEPGEDEAALTRLARWCQRLTPLVAPDPPDGLWLDVTGCAHLWGGEAPLLDNLQARLAQDGITSRAAVASTPGAAHAAARFGGAAIIAPGAEPDALAALPVAALRLPPDTVATLRRLGLERIDALARVPRALLARRFGPEPGHRLDQAIGRAPEPLQPLAPDATLQHRTPFLEPLLTAEALSVATSRLLAALCPALERASLGARRLDLLFERVDGTIQATRVGTARPSRDPAHLQRLLDEHLDRIDPGLGIEAMTLAVPLAEPLRWRQADEGADVATLVDRLANRLGPDRVYRAAPVESDLPERSLRRLPPLERPVGVTWSQWGEAPTRLFDPPHPVDAIAALPDHPPIAFLWRRHRHRVRRADGPERVYGEWWQRTSENSAVRDYFRIEDEDGRRFLLFREGDGTHPTTGDLRWFLQGLF